MRTSKKKSVKTEIKKRGGIVVGPSHAEGGVPFTLSDTGSHIEEEGNEINIPREIAESEKEYEFSGTNFEILNKILKLGNLSLNDKVTEVKSGDIVICIKSAWDDSPRTYKGTIRQILSAINESRGCNHIESGATMENHKTGEVLKMENGGKIGIYVGKEVKRKNTRGNYDHYHVQSYNSEYGYFLKGLKGTEDTTATTRELVKNFEVVVPSVKYGKTGKNNYWFDWESMTFNERINLIRESGLPDKVAIKEAGILSPSELSALKNSIRLRVDAGINKFDKGGLEIWQDDKKILSGDIHVIWNNLTGVNFYDKREYKKYLGLMSDETDIKSGQIQLKTPEGKILRTFDIKMPNKLESGGLIDGYEMTFDEEETKKDEEMEGWTWNYGTLKKDDNEYPFTLLEMYDENSDYSVYEVTWPENEPENSKELENKIISHKTGFNKGGTIDPQSELQQAEKQIESLAEKRDEAKKSGDPALYGFYNSEIAFLIKNYSELGYKFGGILLDSIRGDKEVFQDIYGQDILKNLVDYGFIDENYYLTDIGRQIVKMHDYSFDLGMHPFYYVYNDLDSIYPTEFIKIKGQVFFIFPEKNIILKEVVINDTLRQNNEFELLFNLSPSDKNMLWIPYSYLPPIHLKNNSNDLKINLRHNDKNEAGYIVFRNFENKSALFVNSANYQYIKRKYPDSTFIATENTKYITVIKDGVSIAYLRSETIDDLSPEMLEKFTSEGEKVLSELRNTVSYILNGKNNQELFSEEPPKRSLILDSTEKKYHTIKALDVLIQNAKSDNEKESYKKIVEQITSI